MEPDNLRRSWDRIKKAAGVSLRLHDLRHTCVTLLLDLGVPPHIVREIAGHSALEVTMTIYAHASLEEKYRALTRLDERLAQERLSSESDGRDRLNDLAMPGKQNAGRVSAGRRLVSPAKSWWPGAGSNRRPSAFQADARTN